MIQEKNRALVTDLYELTMAACYFDNDMFEEATFSLFVRNYPPARRYFVAAGLEDVLQYLVELRFEQEDLDYLESTELFKPTFLSYLEKFRFSGDVDALPEGRLFFAQEPILEVTAPIIEAQIVETFIINAVNLQAMIATKASRCVQVAGTRKLVDFSLRRTQGVDAGLKVARASFIGGFAGTSNVLAGKTYGLPVFGTMAHSFISSFEQEIDAFRAFAETFPQNTVLLVDTYETVAGTKKAVKVGKEMAKKGYRLKGVRLDSGDIADLSKEVRLILKESGLQDAIIFASGAFDEHKIQEVIERGAEIDSFGVGTKMGVSADAPYLDMAYKLVSYGGQPVLKLSPKKLSLPLAKQVFRLLTEQEKMEKDIIGLRDDRIQAGEPLLGKVMSHGRIIASLPALEEIKAVCHDEFLRLDDKYKTIGGEAEYFPVELSPRLERLREAVITEVERKELSGD